MRTAPCVRVSLGTTKSLDRRESAIAWLIRLDIDTVTGRELARTLKPRRHA